MALNWKDRGVDREAKGELGVWCVVPHFDVVTHRRFWRLDLNGVYVTEGVWPSRLERLADAVESAAIIEEN